MPAVNFTVQWPDGKQERCYSPSTVVYEYLESGCSYPLDEFMQRSEAALTTASERVQQKFGYACSSAADQLNSIRQRFEEFKQANQSGSVIVLDMTH